MKTSIPKSGKVSTSFHLLSCHYCLLSFFKCKESYPSRDHAGFWVRYCCNGIYWGTWRMWLLFSVSDCQRCKRVCTGVCVRVYQFYHQRVSFFFYILLLEQTPTTLSSVAWFTWYNLVCWPFDNIKKTSNNYFFCTLSCIMLFVLH